MIYIEKNKMDNPLLHTVTEIWNHPVGKIVIVGGLAFGGLYVAGFAFQALAFATRGFKEFTSALKS